MLNIPDARRMISSSREHMIDSIQIKNFRCFKDLSMDGFGKFNIVVGNNASGKTALLEAIFLAQVGHPEVALRLRLWRGLGSSLSFPRNRDGYESIWKDLFFRFRQDIPIEISTQGSQENRWSTKIFYDPKEPSISSMDTEDFSSITPITFEHKKDDEVQTFKPMLTKNEMKFEGGDQSNILVAFFSSSFATAVTPVESATQFSQLDKMGKSGPIVRELRKLYPRIRSIGVQSDGGVPILYCQTKGMVQKIPLGLESSASSKFTAILLGIENNKNGMVLIDEIENGFYYEKLDGAWKAILDLAEKFNVQLFMSTHSIECLRAAAVAIHGREDNVRLLRVESKEGKNIVRMFKGDNFEAAMETETEIR